MGRTQLVAGDALSVSACNRTPEEQRLQPHGNVCSSARAPEPARPVWSSAAPAAEPSAVPGAFSHSGSRRSSGPRAGPALAKARLMLVL